MTCRHTWRYLPPFNIQRQCNKCGITQKWTAEHNASEHCWCGPVLHSTINGRSIWVHRTKETAQ